MCFCLVEGDISGYTGPKLLIRQKYSNSYLNHQDEHCKNWKTALTPGMPVNSGMPWSVLVYTGPGGLVNQWFHNELLWVFFPPIQSNIDDDDDGWVSRVQEITWDTSTPHSRGSPWMSGMSAANIYLLVHWIYLSSMYYGAKSTLRTKCSSRNYLWLLTLTIIHRVRDNLGHCQLYLSTQFQQGRFVLAHDKIWYYKEPLLELIK